MRDPFFEEEPEGESNVIQTIITIFAVIVAAGCIVGLAWYVYNSYFVKKEDQKVSRIVADHSPTKEKPKDPGGMNIPNMDKQIYNKLASPGNEKHAEQILPSHEEPVAREELMQESKEPEEVKAPEIPAPVTQAEPVKKEAATEVKPQEELHPKLSQVTPVEKKQALKTKRRIQDSEIITDNTKLGYRVQVASVRSAKEAEKEWNRIKNKNALANYGYVIDKKDLPGRGIVFRVQVGPFEKAADAKEVCKKLKAAGKDCFVVVPGE